MNAELSEDDRRRWHAFGADRSGAQTEPASRFHPRHIKKWVVCGKPPYYPPGVTASISHFMLDVGRSPKCLHLVQARIRHLGLSPTQKKKRETGIEPATPTLARWCSTAEPLAHLSAPLTLITIHHLRTRVKRLSKVFRFVLIFCIVYTDSQI